MSGLEFGTVGEWFAAIATTAAVVVALGQSGRESRLRRSETHRRLLEAVDRITIRHSGTVLVDERWCYRIRISNQNASPIHGVMVYPVQDDAPWCPIGAATIPAGHDAAIDLPPARRITDDLLDSHVPVRVRLFDVSGIGWEIDRTGHMTATNLKPFDPLGIYVDAGLSRRLAWSVRSARRRVGRDR
jgi:hypothetical protein